jgi:hypothetical protein
MSGATVPINSCVGKSKIYRWESHNSRQENSPSDSMVFLELYQMLKNKLQKTPSSEPEECGNQDLLMRSILLNSHFDERFILDVLSSFQFYALNKEPREFLAVLSSVTELVRLSTESIKEEVVPLSKEIEFIDKFIEVKLMPHSIQYTFEKKIPKKLDANQVNVPAMYVLPYVSEIIDLVLVDNYTSLDFFMTHKLNARNQVIITFSVITCGTVHLSKLEKRIQQGIHIKNSKCKESQRGLLNSRKGKNAYEVKRYDLFESSGQQRGFEVELTFPEN